MLLVVWCCWCMVIQDTQVPHFLTFSYYLYGEQWTYLDDMHMWKSIIFANQFSILPKLLCLSLLFTMNEWQSFWSTISHRVVSHSRFLIPKLITVCISKVRRHFMLYVWKCRHLFGQYWQCSGTSENTKLINGIENEFLGLLVDVTSLIMSIYPLNHKHGCHNLDIGSYIW